MGDNPSSPEQAKTPPASSNNLNPNNSSNDTSPESGITNPSVQQAPLEMESSPSPTSPMGTGPSARQGRRGHERIGSTSTSTSRPEGYPSWIPRRPPPPEPPSTVGLGTRPSTRAGFESPDSLADIDWELMTPAAREDISPTGVRYSEDLSRASDFEGEAIPSTSAAAEGRRDTLSGLPPGVTKTERKPTPRSVRIVSVPGLGPAVAGTAPLPTASGSREASDSTRVPSGSVPGYRAYSRATGASALSPTLFSSLPSRGGYGQPGGRFASDGRATQYRRSIPPAALSSVPFPPLSSSQPLRPPRFRTPKFHPTLLRDPSSLTRARYFAWSLFVIFGHIIVQTFLDFNVVYMMIQVAKYPTLTALGTSASRKDWIWATVAYIACWAIWLIGIVILYEAVYCFWRRWRVKRPLVIPIYLSSPSYNLVCLTSYTNFCFMQHIRWSAIYPYSTLAVDDGSDTSARKDALGLDADWVEVRKQEVKPGPDDKEKLETPTKPSAEGPQTDSSDPVSYTTPSNGSRPSEEIQQQGSGDKNNHRRKLSQAQTLSSGKRASEGFQSDVDGGGISASEGKPQISELASSIHSNEAEPQPPETAVLPPPRRPTPRGADGSAFLEHRASFASTSSSGSGSSVGSVRFGRDVLQFVAESCWFYSQNTPTVVTLLPRLGITLALYITFVGPSTGTSLGLANGLGRDGTFFGGNGQLSGYSKVIIWIQLAWGLWRIGVLLASWFGLWIFSGLGCGGLCGPRYRWEEGYSDMDDAPLPYVSEKRQSVRQPPPTSQPTSQSRGSVLVQGPGNRASTYTIPDSRFSDRVGRRAFVDPDDHTLNWSWMERCRDRIWDTWEFCLTRPNTVGADATDAYWSAWRSAAQGGGDGPEGGESLPAHIARERSLGVPVTAANASTAGSTAPFLSSTANPGTSSFGQAATGIAGYPHLDTVLATLPEMSSNPSLAASSAMIHPPPATAPNISQAAAAAAIPPIFTASQSPRRPPLSQDLFVGPTGAPYEIDPGASIPQPVEETSWLGSSAVPLAGPVSKESTAPGFQPYPFPGYSSATSPGPKTILPFPLTPVAVHHEESISPTQPLSSRHAQHIFPTPATTVQSLPFPITQPGASPSNLSPPPQVEGHEFQEGDPTVSEHGLLYPPSRAASHSGTGSMSSLGQPIQTRYPVGYRRPRGRRSSASASGSGAGSSNPRESYASGSGSNGGFQLQAQSPRDSVASGSASTSGYGSPAMIRGQRSRSTHMSGASIGSGDGEYVYAVEVEPSVASGYSSPVEPGMAGVGAGGGMGPRASLVNLAQPSPSHQPQYIVAIPPPPRHPSGSRRRAGTLPSPTSGDPSPPPLPGPVPPYAVLNTRTRVASVPNPPSGTRDHFAPSPGAEIDMPPFDYESGDDDDEEAEGSQEAAEREDSVGLLSQAPSRRSSASGMNLRARTSNLSLQRRSNGSRSVSITSAGHNSAGNIRSRAASLIRRRSQPAGLASPSQESLSGEIPQPDMFVDLRSRHDSGVPPAPQTPSHYSDARSRTHSEPGSATDSGSDQPVSGRPQDMTFGVRVPWDADATIPASSAGGPSGVQEPSTVRQRSVPSSQVDLPAGAPSVSQGSHSGTTPSDPSQLGVPSGPRPVAIPGISRPDLSTANASFVTAQPSVDTHSVAGHSEDSDGTFARGHSHRYFLEGGGYGPR